jgi:N4-gp56 family major capsid protein
MTWGTHSGYLSNAELNMQFQMSAQPLLRFRQFVGLKDAFGKQKGESVNWLKVADLGTIGGKLVETNTFHQSSQSLTWGTLTVDEYGNSIPFTFKIETLSRFDLEEIIREGLQNDMVKVVDGLVERQFNACKLRYVGSSTTTYALTTNGTATVSNTSVLNTYHVRKMVTELRKRSVKGFSKAGGDYVFNCSVEAMENIVAALESVHQYTESGFQPIANGEAGRYYMTRFVEDQFATRYVYDSTARTATAISWAQAQSGVGYLFGQGTVREAVAVPEEIRMKIPTDYGRSKGIAWYALLGHKIEWETAGDTRIIKWDTAG